MSSRLSSNATFYLMGITMGVTMVAMGVPLRVTVLALIATTVTGLFFRFCFTLLELIKLHLYYANISPGLVVTGIAEP